MKATVVRPTHLNVNAVRADALFVSALQRSAEPTVVEVQDVIAETVRRLGGRGCAASVAAEFGDHPELAVTRMRWARRLVDEAFGGSELAARHGRLIERCVAARAA